jgi:hypothetical protein
VALCERFKDLSDPRWRKVYPAIPRIEFRPEADTVVASPRSELTWFPRRRLTNPSGAVCQSVERKVSRSGREHVEDSVVSRHYGIERAAGA